MGKSYSRQTLAATMSGVPMVKIVPTAATADALLMRGKDVRWEEATVKEEILEWRRAGGLRQMEKRGRTKGADQA